MAYTMDCVARVLWIVVWLRYCGLLYGSHCGLCGYGIVDFCVAEVLWIVVRLRYCSLLCG